MNVQLFVNGFQVEIKGDEIIAVDYAIASIGNFETRNSYRSANFSVAKTANNRRIFESAEIVQNQTTIPYRRLDCRVFQDGIDMQIRFCDIESIDDNYNLRLYGGNADFFDLIKKPLNEIDFSYNHIFDLSTVVASRTNTEGYIYPIIDYHTDAPNTSIPFTNYDVRYIFPSLFIDTLLEKICDNAGYTLINELPQTIPIYNDADLILPLTNNQYNEFIEVEENDIGNTTANQLRDFSFLGEHFIVDFDDTTTNNNSFVNSTESIIFSGIGSVSLTKNFYIINFQSNYKAVANVRINATNVSEGSIFFIIARNNGGNNQNITSVERVVPNTLGLGRTFEYSIEFDEFRGELNDQIYLYVFATSPAGVQQVNALTNINIYPSSFNFGDYVYLKYKLPNTLQSDIFKTYSQLYGVLIQSDEITKEVKIFSYQNVINEIPNAYNWSDKIDYTETETIEFDLGKYAQRNLLKYKDQSNQIKPIGTDGVLIIDDNTLDGETVVFTLIYAATQMVFRLNNLIPNIPVYTTSTGSPPETEIKNKPEPRLLLLDREVGSIDYTDGSTTTTVTTNLPLAWFIRADKSYNLGFQNSLIPNFYQTLQSVLTRSKIVTENIRLTSVDILELDFMKPVYLDKHNAYFYISKIKNYVLGSRESVEVELVKLR
jgi:hypothetical protein